MIIHSNLNKVSNMNYIFCNESDYTKRFEFMVVRNPFRGHACKFFENRVFQKHCENLYYSPVSSNTECYHAFKDYNNGLVTIQYYHTWSDSRGNFYTYDPLLDMYVKWDLKGNILDWGIRSSYFDDWSEISSNNIFVCFENFGRKWCKYENNELPQLFFPFTWNSPPSKKCLVS